MEECTCLIHGFEENGKKYKTGYVYDADTTLHNVNMI